MEWWLIFAIFSQAISALTVFIDKYVLVAKTGIRSPYALSFYTAALGGAALLLLPFGVVHMPTGEALIAGVVSSIAYVFSLILLYHTLRMLSATNVVPITASAGAIVTGLLAVFFLAQDLPLSSMPAFVLLTIGTLCVYCFCFPRTLLFMALASGALVGVSAFATKIAFSNSPDFLTGLFWLLITNVVVAALMILPFKWKEVTRSYGESSHGAKWLVLASKALGGGAFFLTAIAIQQGNVSVVSALGGLQLVFLLIFVPLFAHKIPDVFKYELTRETLILKVVGIVFIVAGLAFLFVPF